MTEKTVFPSPMQLAFRRASKTVCNRYAELKAMAPVQQGSPVGHHGGQNFEKNKSYAQVAAFVGQQVVGQKSCGLKPGASRLFRVTARFSQREREILVRRAGTACLTLSEFIRSTVLRAEYVPTVHPEKRQILLDMGRELVRQGNNFNQIARQLNSGTATLTEAEAMLLIVARSLVAVHTAIKHALTEGGRSMD